MHLVALNLDLMATNDGHKVVVIKKFLCWFFPKEERAFALLVINIVPIISDLV